ncbi:hypothetical protein [Nocardia jiangsuensis]|uniref:Uncharacterized protein n=1 Tax=Nocardia jiangsuensis TaxID=1691563 RepID=A0ABV8DRB5_9NOCA
MTQLDEGSTLPLESGPRRPHRPLLVACGLMAALLLWSLAGLVLDDRLIGGEPAWAKPAKFAAAFVLYTATLAWLLGLPHRGSRVTRCMGTIFAVTTVVDVGFVVVQAARGTFSHFNTESDAVNTVGQLIFASGVPGLFAANLVIAVVVLWQRVADRPVTLAIRAGLVLAVAGMALGYLMGFTGARTAEAADGRAVELVGSHTVGDRGVRDDPAGLPVTHWSTTGGDLRVPHFVGLHGMQVLLLAAVALGFAARRYPALREERARARLVGVLAAAWTGLLALTLWQALRGVPPAAPDGPVLLTGAALLAATALGVALVLSAAVLRRAPATRVSH